VLCCNEEATSSYDITSSSSQEVFFTHGPPSGPSYPRIHTQLDLDRLPTCVVKEKSGQFAQAEAPARFENFPAGQCTQAATLVSDAYFPTAHLAHVEAPAPANVPGAQSRQSKSLSAA